MPAISFTPINLLAVLQGKKTETRRLLKGGRVLNIDGLLHRRAGHQIRLDKPLDDQTPIYATRIVSPIGTLKYAVGKTYAITPGRGKKGVGRVLVKQLTIEPLFQIDQASVDRECFGRTPTEYIQRFQALYNKPERWNPMVVAIRFELVEPAITKETLQ